MRKALLILPLALLLGGCNTTQQKFRRADVNHDKKLSKAEFTDGVAVILFGKFDANKDGVVTIEEWRVVEGTKDDAGFKKRDPNKDGKITLSEAKQMAAKGPRFKQCFDDIDINRDGSIEWVEVEEFKKAHSASEKPVAEKPAEKPAAGKPATKS